MNKQIDKAKFLELVRVEHDFLQRTVVQLSLEQFVEPGVTGTWSVKDILAHITVWEQRFMRWLDAAVEGTTPERPEPGFTWDDLDKLNERDYLNSRSRQPAEVMLSFMASYEQIFGRLSSLSEAVLFTPGYYTWTGERCLWEVADANSAYHYKEHAIEIRAWLIKKQAE